MSDRDLLTAARAEAQALLDQDPSLGRYQTLAEAVERYTAESPGGAVA